MVGEHFRYPHPPEPSAAGCSYQGRRGVVAAALKKAAWEVLFVLREDGVSGGRRACCA